jgi:uncharacterized membrane protein (UPF0127 family)
MARTEKQWRWCQVFKGTPKRSVSRALTTSLVLTLVALGVGCAPVETSSAEPTPPAPTETDRPTAPPSANPSPTSMAPSTGQRLPITAMATIGDQEVLLEVAATPRQQALGLMFREPLPDHHGMLFPMGRPRPVSFWMKNVPGPLDMLFIYDETVIYIAADVPPCAAEPCPTYGPGSQLVEAVIELRGGHAAELGLTEGDRVVISPVEATLTPSE